MNEEKMRELPWMFAWISVGAGFQVVITYIAALWIMIPAAILMLALYAKYVSCSREGYQEIKATFRLILYVTQALYMLSAVLALLLNASGEELFDILIVVGRLVFLFPTFFYYAMSLQEES